MKKKVALVLSVGVLISTISPVQVLAKTNNTEVVSKSKLDVEKYIPKIKSILQIGDEYNNFDIYRYDSDGATELSWSSDNSNISVNIDEDGNIVSYWKHVYDRNRVKHVYKFPSISREQGEKIAKDFIKKVAPEISSKIEIKNDYEGYGIYSRYDLGEHSYEFVRTENNIPFNNDRVYVRIDSQNGEVQSFTSGFEKNLKIPSKEGIISEDEAKVLYKENIGLELIYKLRGIDNGFEPYLGYNIINSDKTIDAKTKDIVSTSQHYYYPLDRYAIHGINIEQVSSAEESKLVNSKEIISKKDASKKIIDTFKLSAQYELSSSRLETAKKDNKYVWTMSFIKYEKDGDNSIGASVDAKTGEVIEYYDSESWEDNENDKVKYSKEELLKKAKDFIQKSNPEKYKEVEYVERTNTYFYDETKIQKFEFIRKSNDIKVENSGFRIGMSAVTGNIESYGYSWDDSELPLAENIIDKDNAKDILFNNKTLELQYQNENQDQKNIKLVYDFKDKHLVVDAETGEIIDSQKEMSDKYSKKDYKDIENSFAKNHINKLQENIILFEGDEFKPKSEILQKDFLHLLAQTKGMLYTIDEEEFTYEILTEANIINKEEKNPEGKVTREEAMKYIVRAFGQEQSGNLGNIYRIDYNDADQISDNLKGHVAIASGLGIISGEGNFRPKDNLTREEAVVLIYNILNRSN